ncbi:MAG: hypothetical protein IT463_09455 [Planctomycetes bacterium]|nr:hypothetical protein [Planctomycetota bacterium]
MGEFDNDQGPVEGTKAQGNTLPCAQCGAELEFRPGSTVLKCGYCGHSQQIQVAAGAAVVEYDLNDAVSRYLGKVAHMQTQGRRQIKCEDCGADIIVEAGATTARCDYCGGKRIVEEEVPPGVLQPEGILPFQFDSNSAVERFRKWLAGEGFFGRLWVRLVRPSALQQRASVQDLHGIYVPFWTYDSNAQSYWTAQAGYYYYVTEHYTDSQGKRQSRQARKIRWVWTNGQRRDHYDDWLVCASRQYYQGDLQRLMKEIEPFPTKQLTPFDQKYLAGFRAERYSMDLKQCWDIARDGMLAECRTRCSRDVPGDTHRFLEVRTSFFGQSFKHVLLPVFVMGYRFKEKSYNVLVNGSTGEVRGGAPLSWIKLTILIVALLALIGGAIALFSIYGKQPQPANQGGQPAAATEAPATYFLPVTVKRADGDETVQVQFSFAGADAAARLANWKEFEATGMKSKVESEIESVVKADTRSGSTALTEKISRRLAEKFTLAGGGPRFDNVQASFPQGRRKP